METATAPWRSASAELMEGSWLESSRKASGEQQMGSLGSMATLSGVGRFFCYRLPSGDLCTFDAMTAGGKVNHTPRGMWSDRLRRCRVLYDRLSPVAVDGTGNLKQFGALEAANLALWVDGERPGGVADGAGANAKLVGHGRQGMADGAVGLEVLVLG